MTSSSGAWVSESKEVRLSRRFAILASRDTRSPSGLTKTYSAAQYRSAVATSALRSASSYSRMDSRSSASALLVAAELDSCAVAAAGARRISVRNDTKQSRFRIMGASLKHADVRAPSAKYIHPLTSPFRALVHAQTFYIHHFAQFADVHSRMLFESRCDAVFDVLPARWPPYLFALRLRLAGNGRLFDSNLLKFDWHEFDSPGHAIAREFAACGPPDLFLLGLCLARSPRLFQGNFLSAGNLRSLGRGRRECGTTNNYCGHKAGT